jgi:predicted PurR-regulated permease PerM
MPDDRKKLIFWQIKALQLLVFSLVGFLAILFIKVTISINEVLIAFFLAILINYLLSKPVTFLTKYIKFRLISVLLIYIIFIASITFIGIYVIPMLSDQLKALVASLPKILNKLESSLHNLTQILYDNQIEIPEISFNKDKALQKILNAIENSNFSDYKLLVTNLVKKFFNVLIYVILTLISSFYLLLDGDKIWNLFLVPFSARIRDNLDSIKVYVDRGLYAFIIGQFQIATLTTLVMLTTYFILDAPYAVILGSLQMLEIVPVLGTWFAIVPSILIIMFSTSFSKGLIAFVVYLIYTQIFRDNFIAPAIMGGALGFHPLAIILSLIIGAKLAGPIGIIFALPVIALVGSIFQFISDQEKLKLN